MFFPARGSNFKRRAARVKRNFVVDGVSILTERLREEIRQGIVHHYREEHAYAHVGFVDTERHYGYLGVNRIFDKEHRIALVVEQNVVTEQGTFVHLYVFGNFDCRRLDVLHYRVRSVLDGQRFTVGVACIGQSYATLDCKPRI